jgi:hypothetical protein
MYTNYIFDELGFVESWHKDKEHHMEKHQEICILCK